MKGCYASYIFLFLLLVWRHRQHAWCMPAVRKVIFLLHWQSILRNCKALFCATCRLAMPHLFRTTVSYLNINDLFPLCIRYDETLPHCITIGKKCFTLSISFLLLSLFPVCPFSSSLIAKGTKMHNKGITYVCIKIKPKKHKYIKTNKQKDKFSVANKNILQCYTYWSENINI